MAFEKKTWVDRVSENPTRRTLTDVSTGAETVVDVARNEGEISQTGDAFNAENMNDLEDRIEAGLDEAGLVQGTSEEIAAMIAQGELSDGQQVVITDDYVNGKTIDELKSEVSEISENLSQLGLHLLWTNGAPTSNFAAQTISLDLSEYDLLLFCYKFSTASTVIRQPLNGIKGVGAINMTLSASDRTISRDATITDEGVTFTACTNSPISGSGSTDNSKMIPYYIYGLKA